MKPLRILLLAAALALGVASDLGARTGGTSFSVSAVVRPAAVLKFEGSSVELRLSSVDISRGYLDVPTHAQLTIVSGRDVRRVVNVTVEFEPHPDILRSIQVDARPSAGGSTDLRYASSTSLAYRLFLTGRRKAESFTIPLTLSVHL